ncbi:MAG: transketolase family protein [Defluviitaleaceae bacterium]|nr:transketolase family protein [Defluviitaleaceae bacterium]
MLKEGTKEIRQVYVDTLINLAAKDKNIVVMEADLAASIGTVKFKEKYPDQFVNCGIMEAQMVGAAAGLSLAGKRPFLHTFATFATRRPYDQIFISLGYARLGATILGSDPGVCAEHNGGTHMPFEDIALMRTIPNCTVAEPSDEYMMKALIEMSYEKGGLWYIRAQRKKAMQIYTENEKFELGKAKVVKDGKDVCIIASGICVSDALQAASLLEKKGIDAAVIDMFMIDPLDKDIILKYAKSCGQILTVENHFIVNGLGSAAAEVIAESGTGVKFKRLGVDKRYGQTGSLNFLKKEYGIDAESIAAAAEGLAK